MADGEGIRKSRSGAPLPEIPDKLYLRIGEVARLLSLPTHVLRFWEGEFPHLRPFKGGTGQRLYRRKDIQALLEVRGLLYDRGYTIAGARQHLAEHAQHAETAVETHHTPVASAAHPDAGDALQQVYAGLQELSQLLWRPAEMVSNAKHLGAHPAVRKRPADFQDTPSLFAPATDEGPEGVD